MNVFRSVAAGGFLFLGACAAAPSLVDTARISTPDHFDRRVATATAEEINARDKRGDTALIAAVETGDARKVRSLLDRGARVDMPKIQRFPEFTSTYPIVGLAILHSVGKRENTDIVRALVDKGADVEDPLKRVNPNTGATTYVESPLYMAAANNMTTVVKILLDHGANPNGDEKYESRVDAGSYIQVAPLSSYRLTAEMAELLISRGAEVNPKRGTRPLCAAAGQGNVPLMVALLSHGADVNAPLADGSSIANCATAPATVDLLVAMGLDPNRRDGKGRNAKDYTVLAAEKEAKLLAQRQQQAERAAAAEQARKAAAAEQARQQAQPSPSSGGLGDTIFRQALGGAIQNLGAKAAGDGSVAGGVIGGSLSGIGRNFAAGKDDPESTQSAMVAGAGAAVTANMMGRAAASGGGRPATGGATGASAGGSNAAAAGQCKSQADRVAPYGNPQLDTLCKQATMYACLSSQGVGGAQTAEYKTKTCAVLRSSAAQMGGSPSTCRAC